MKNVIFKSGFLFGLILLSSLFIFPASAQTKYWVLLKDKKGVSFDPYSYFDHKTISRRLAQNIPLASESDKPLNPAYVAQITANSDSVSGQSRWFNAVACFATGSQVKQLQKLPFVKEVLPMPEFSLDLAAVTTKETSELKPDDLDILKNQTASLGGEIFKAKGLDGKGIRIAVFDAGFKAVDQSSAFEHLRNEKRIVKTWDFVKKREYVYDYATHGTMVLSCIGGKTKDQNIGLATGAEFLLARTERMHSEKFSEEEHWLEALEWADKNGADIINSSLGYTNNRYFREQMDGKTSLVSRAAEMAFEKGMLIVNAAGNDGDGNWKYLGAPADAEHVLTVGGIDPETFLHVGFSSYGPTADKRLKPNVAAFGIVIAAGPNGLNKTQGTSFASPLVAGFAACAWQQNRKLTNVGLFKAIEGAGHLFPYYDYAHGFGVPQAAYFLEDRSGLLHGENENFPKATFEFETQADQVLVKIKPGYMPDSDKANQYIANLQPTKFRLKDYLYYHIQNPAGVLEKYYVVEVEKDLKPVAIKFSELQKGYSIQVHYKGYSQDFVFPGR